MKNILYLSLILLSVVFSCNYDGDGLYIQKLKGENSINQFSDTSFFADIRSIVYYNDKFFITDYSRNKIFILNANLELEKTLGNKGNGPGELLGASHLYVCQDTIFVLNDEKRTIEIFSFEKHLKTIDIHQNIYLNSSKRFCVHQENILLSSFNSSASIAVVPFITDTITWFGNYARFSTEKETRIKNARHLHEMGDIIISIPDRQPIIEMYNIKGELLSISYFDKINLVNKLLNFTDKQKKEINSYYNLFSDTYVSGNYVYILTLSVDENDKIQCNTVVQFERINNSMLPKKIFQLDDGWFGPICIAGDNILAYNNVTSELILYKYE